MNVHEMQPNTREQNNTVGITDPTYNHTSNFHATLQQSFSLSRCNTMQSYVSDATTPQGEKKKKVRDNYCLYANTNFTGILSYP